MKALSNIFLMNQPHLPVMLQTLEKRRKYIAIILSDEHTVIVDLSNEIFSNALQWIYGIKSAILVITFQNFNLLNISI